LIRLQHANNFLDGAECVLAGHGRRGQGDLAAGDWDRGLSKAERLGDETVAAEIIEDPDLHEHITKSLYEAKLSS
jgi:hypothetical protein